MYNVTHKYSKYILVKYQIYIYVYIYAYYNKLKRISRYRVKFYYSYKCYDKICFNILYVSNVKKSQLQEYSMYNNSMRIK